MGDGTAVSKTGADLLGNRRFESISLQRRVRLSPASGFEGREPRLSARVCAAGLATGSAETRRAFHFAPNRRQYLCRAIFQYRSAADVGGENTMPAPTKLGLLRGQRAGDRKISEFGSGS